MQYRLPSAQTRLGLSMRETLRFAVRLTTFSVGSASELREMSVAELNKKLADLKQELFNLRFQHAINQLENPIRINAVKKDIARVMTALAEKA